MRNPLNKRLKGEFKRDIARYLVIFILIAGMISMVSGFLVADESMIQTYNESFTKYHIEDGHFTVNKPLTDSDVKTIEEQKVKIYDLSYIEKTLSNKTTLRIYKNRTQVDQADVMSGRLAQKAGEIAIDRMYADNNHLSVGDTIKSGSNKWKIVGLVALSDYSCLFENNSDMMFDSVKFGVGCVSAQAFNQFDNLTYNYAWIYNTKPKDENKTADQLMQKINETVSLSDFVPQYMNQAITFTGEDMGSDRAMFIMLLYILIVIIAFVFGVTISNTLQVESKVIGTLRSCGYTIHELIVHYMMLPMMICIIGAVVGNIVGYTVMKNYMAGLYYGSYSLPTYHTIWSASAFIETTLFPLALLFVIDYVILKRKLSYSPLAFLRSDFSKAGKHHVRLAHKIRFITRYRLRIILQNIPAYLTILIGVLFANLLLLFALAFPVVIHNYQNEMPHHMLAKYQYILKEPDVSSDMLTAAADMNEYYYHVTTTNASAEKFSAYTLKTTGDDAKVEDVAVYGVKKHSKYIKKGTGNYISSTMSEKYNLKKGDSIILKEPYKNVLYKIDIDGVYPYEGSISVFMDQKDLNENILGADDDYFSGYFTNTKITDIDRQYISTIIDIDSVTKVSRQLDVSMGGAMTLVQAISVIMFMLIVYLLGKLVIEKNTYAISMIKILGYSNKEISRLYVMSTTIVAIASIIISLPLEYLILKPLYLAVMKQEMTGWISFNVPLSVYLQMLVYGVVAYLLVSILVSRRIRHVSLSMALKNQE